MWDQIKRVIHWGVVCSLFWFVYSLVIHPDQAIQSYLRWVHRLEMAYSHFELHSHSLKFQQGIWTKQGLPWLTCEELVWEWDRWWAPWKGKLFLRGASLLHDPSMLQSKEVATGVPGYLGEFAGEVYFGSAHQLPIYLHVQGTSCHLHIALDHQIKECAPLIQQWNPSLLSWMTSLVDGRIKGSMTLIMEKDQPMRCDAHLRFVNLIWASNAYPIATITGEGNLEMHSQGKEHQIHAEWVGSLAGLAGTGYMDIHTDRIDGQWMASGVGNETWPAPFWDINTAVQLQVQGTPDHVVCSISVEGEDYGPWEGGLEYVPQEQSWGRGWIHLPHVDMAHWVSPFLLGDFSLRWKGQSDLWAAFDAHQLLFWVLPHEWVLQGDSFSLQLYDEQETWAYGTYSWAEGLLCGSMPVYRACYEQKNREVILDHLKGTLRTQGRRIFFDDVDVIWQSLPIYGNVVAEIQGADSVDLSIQAGCQEAPLSDGIQLLSHFVDVSLTDWDWDGSFSVLPSDCSFCFHLTPDATEQKGYIRGSARYQVDVPLGILGEGATLFHYESDSLSLSYGTGSFLWRGVEYEIDDVSLYVNEERGSLYGRMGDGSRFEARYDPYELFIHYGDHHQIDAYQDSGTWTTECLMWGGWEGSAHWGRENQGWHAQHIQLHHPEYGDWMGSLQWIEKRIELEGDFQVHSVEKLLCSLPASWKGTCQGRIQGSWSPNTGMEGLFEMTESTYQWKEEPIKKLPPLFIRCQPEGWEFRGWEELGLYNLESVSYESSENAIHLRGLSFEFTPSQCATWMSFLQDSFWSLDLKYRIAVPVSGTLSLVWKASNLEMQFDPFRLRWKDNVYLVPSMLWKMTPQAISGQGTFVEGTHTLLAFFAMERSPLATGTLLLQQEGEGDGLTCSWHHHPYFGWVMDRIEGRLLDSVAHIRYVPGQEANHWALDGHVVFNPKSWGPFLPHDWRKTLQKLQLCGVYEWHGNLIFPKGSYLGGEMRGTLVGTECSLLEVQWASFRADCTATIEQIALRNLHLQDWAGTALCEALILSKQNGWRLEIPHIELQDIRLAHLDSPWTRYQKGEKNLLRTLHVSSWELSHLSGAISDWRTFIGSGSCTFSTLPRRSLLGNLMMIPTEISARIGLDISNFIPARGTILFDIREGKVELINLLDMYSEAKRSRFYLEDTVTNFIDLTGKMHVAVRMKQYNLLMKWVDWFTLTISGSVNEPRYTLTPATRAAEGEL